MKSGLFIYRLVLSAHQIVDAHVKMVGYGYKLRNARLAVTAFPMRNRHFGHIQNLSQSLLRFVVFHSQFFQSRLEFHIQIVTNFVTKILTVTKIVTILYILIMQKPYFGLWENDYIGVKR